MGFRQNLSLLWGMAWGSWKPARPFSKGWGGDGKHHFALDRGGAVGACPGFFFHLAARRGNKGGMAFLLFFAFGLFYCYWWCFPAPPPRPLPIPLLFFRPCCDALTNRVAPNFFCSSGKKKATGNLNKAMAGEKKCICIFAFYPIIQISMRMEANSATKTVGRNCIVISVTFIPLFRNSGPLLGGWNAKKTRMRTNCRFARAICFLNPEWAK